jgi:prolyl 4-hydroxylase
VRAKEEKTGALDWVEKKMARATMIPRAHGEINGTQQSYC